MWEFSQFLIWREPVALILTRIFAMVTQINRAVFPGSENVTSPVPRQPPHSSYGVEPAPFSQNETANCASLLGNGYFRRPSSAVAGKLTFILKITSYFGPCRMARALCMRKFHVGTLGCRRAGNSRFPMPQFQLTARLDTPTFKTLDPTNSFLSRTLLPLPHLETCTL